jgi:hypothetical protein
VVGKPCPDFENYIAKYYFDEKSSFLHSSLISLNAGSLRQV